MYLQKDIPNIWVIQFKLVLDKSNTDSYSVYEYYDWEFRLLSQERAQYYLSLDPTLPFNF